MEIKEEGMQEEYEAKHRKEMRDALVENDMIVERKSEHVFLMIRRDRRSMLHTWFTFVPFHIMIAGDVGNASFNISESDSLHWLLTCNCMSYVLSKMDPRHRHHVFYKEEALAQMVKLIEENDLERNTFQEEHDGKLAELAKEKMSAGLRKREEEELQKEYDEQMQEFEEREEKLEEVKEGVEDEDHDPSYQWHRLWSQVLEDCEPPPCEGPDDEMLSIFEVMMYFRELHKRDFPTVPNKPESAASGT